MEKPKKKRKSRSKYSDSLPKGSYRLPWGGYVSESIGPPDKFGRRVRLRAVHNPNPDPKELARVLVQLVTRLAAKELADSGHPDIPPATRP